MLAASLINYADDEGYFNANPGLIKAECSPLREPSVSIPESLLLLAEVGYLELGEGEDGKRYGRLVTFDEHQRVNRPTPSKIKALHVDWGDSMTNHGVLTESSLPERKGKEGKGRDSNVGSSSVEVSEIIDAYHAALPNCASIRVVTDKRKREIRAAEKTAKALCRERGWDYGLDFWQDFFAECAKDPYYRGDVPNPKNPDWKQNLSVLLRDEHFAKVMDKALAGLQA
jgi:hypothetical protein